MLPEEGSINRNKVLPNVVLPQPLSPTKPKVSPLKISKLALFTAVNQVLGFPSRLVLPGNLTVRFSTCKRTGPWVDGIPLTLVVVFPSDSELLISLSKKSATVGSRSCLECSAGRQAIR